MSKKVEHVLVSHLVFFYFKLMGSFFCECFTASAGNTASFYLFAAFFSLATVI